jgi:hypothetical protein
MHDSECGSESREIGEKRTCGGYLAHPFANQMDVLLIASCFSELWHAQIKEYKSISRVYLYHAEQTLFIFSCGGS